MIETKDDTTMRRYVSGGRTRRALLRGTAVAVAAGVAGCSGGDDPGTDDSGDDTGTSSDDTTDSDAQTPADPAGQEPGGPSDYAFRLDDQLPSGFRNEGVIRREGDTAVGSQAWAFDDSYIRTDYVWGETDHDGTLAAWVYVPATETNNDRARDILSAHDDGQTGNTRFAQLGLRQRSDGTGVALVKNKVRADAAVPTAADFPVGEWFHLAGVVDKAAGEVRLYLDGQLEATEPDIDITMEQEGVFAVGARAKNRAGTYIFDRRFVGRLDDVRAYDRTLDAAEIAALAGTNPDDGAGEDTSQSVPSVLQQSLPDPEQYLAQRQIGSERDVGTVEISTRRGRLVLRGPGTGRVTAIAGYLAADDLTPEATWGKTVDDDTKLIGTAAGERQDGLTFDSFRGVALRAVAGIDLVVDGERVATDVRQVRYTPEAGVIEQRPLQ
ncbi:LamG domain-containing protein [Halorientalis pallida]|uniref:LamG domain-containing protein n=1 Tax=Halorientalis pallida TaxID=2479928 RepID=A0A498L6W8_9EURY|nr:LamG domain-containing protein [Halorientalis pallida]RXK50455.1 LamG domain-containing protein [Halorientalis pallida]